MTDLIRLADDAAWRAAREDVRIAGHGHRQAARRRLQALVRALLARDVAAARVAR